MKNLVENPKQQAVKNESNVSDKKSFGDHAIKELNENITEHQAFVQLESILNNNQSKLAMATNQKTVKVELTESQIYNLSVLDKLLYSCSAKPFKSLQELFFRHLINTEHNGDELCLEGSEIYDIKLTLDFLSDVRKDNF